MFIAENLVVNYLAYRFVLSNDKMHLQTHCKLKRCNKYLVLLFSNIKANDLEQANYI